MLQTRLWMGAVLIALAVGVLTVDQRFSPWYPLLFILVLALSCAACVELVRLFPPNRRPAEWLCLVGVAAVVSANWVVHIPQTSAVVGKNAWLVVSLTFAGFVAGAFLAEMATFNEPGDSVPRLALSTWVVGYLGILPSFLVQLRWQNEINDAIAPSEIPIGTIALALAIFVPKCCDIGAYFTGRFLGRHHMAPVLSPKKTWEGAAGGLAAAVIAAVGINRLTPVLPDLATEIGFGLSVGAAGMLGDLAESLIKRDCRQKDASHVVPGFGGILDVVDAVLFAAPVAYLWIANTR
jgi:phosphatidate cytidylyltransferase